MESRRLTAAARAGMFLFGIVMAALGAVLPVITARVGMSLAQAGALFLALNLAMLVASLTLGPLTDRFGLRWTLLLGPLLVLAALAGLAKADSAAGLMVSMAAMGLGGGALNLGSNTLVADLHDNPSEKNAALNVLGVFFGIGALVIPFQVATLLSTLGLTGILAAAAVLCAAASVYSAMLRFPPAKLQERAPFAAVASLAATPLVLTLGALLFFQSGNEFLLGGYISLYLTREAGLSLSGASWVLAGFWAAILVARILLGRLLLQVRGERVVLGAAACACAGAALAWSAGDARLASAGIVLTGFSLAGIFPTVLGLAGSHFRERSGAVFGVLFTMALTGGMVVPWAAGRLAEQQGVRIAFAMASVGFAMIFVMQMTAKRWLRRDM